MVVETGPKCSTWARDRKVDPIGTAGNYAGFLLMEWPLPWPSDVKDIVAMDPVREELAVANVRLQLLVPGSPAPSRQTRLSLYWRPTQALEPGGQDEGWFAGYQMSEASAQLNGAGAQLGDAAAAPAELVPVVRHLLAQARHNGPSPRPLLAPDRVLICTHGSRDTCCGSLGMDLVKAMNDLSVADGSTSPAGRAVRCRTSHTGGHRFAPTAIILPQGTVWAFLDAPTLERILERSGPVDTLVSRYRGCAGLGTKRVQVLERALFAEVGWEWLDYRRRGWDLPDDGVVLEAIAPDGTTRAWRASVRPGRVLPVPVCRQSLAGATKFEPELRLSDLRET